MAGETTAVPAVAARTYYDNPGAGAFVVSSLLTFGTTDNELNDVMQAGYLPPNVKLLAVGFYPTDMDTNGSPAVVHKVTVGATDVVTGLTGAQTGASSLTPVTNAARVLAPSTSPTLVQVQTTTAAATAAAGTAVLDLWCQKA
jgi:hypothetical protein